MFGRPLHCARLCHCVCDIARVSIADRAYGAYAAGRRGHGSHHQALGASAWLVDRAGAFFCGAGSVAVYGPPRQAGCAYLQPPLAAAALQTGANLLWVWRRLGWYISGLLLLIGGVGILLDLNSPRPEGAPRLAHMSLAVHLAVLAAGLLFVGSGNVLTAIMTWVVLRRPDHPPARDAAAGVGRRRRRGCTRPRYRKAAWALGALLLLVGLLPPGVGRPTVTGGRCRRRRPAC